MRTYQWGPFAARKQGKGLNAQVERAKTIQKMLTNKMDVIDISESLGMTKAAVYRAIQTYGLRFPE